MTYFCRLSTIFIFVTATKSIPTVPADYEKRECLNGLGEYSDDNNYYNNYFTLFLHVKNYLVRYNFTLSIVNTYIRIAKL